MSRMCAALALALSLASMSGYATEQSAMAEGEVRRVDPAAKKVTIRHGPLPKLDMPAMTMVFQVSDPALLEQLKPGDRIRFDAEKVDGNYRVTKIEPVR